MQSCQKTNSNSSLDYSFLFSKLEQFSRENILYKKAFAQIEEVANRVAAGDMTARIGNLDTYGKINPTLVAVNKAYDFTDNYVCASEASQITALTEQDEFRKKQMRELKDYFMKQMASLKTNGQS